MLDPNLRKGVVSSYNDKDGFGYITTYTNKEYYFKITNVQGNVLPVAGDQVVFQIDKKNETLARQIQITKRNEKIIRQVITCPKCGKEVLPKVNFYKEKPTYTTCPECGEILKDIKDENKKEVKKRTALYTFIYYTVNVLFVLILIFIFKHFFLK